jgi:hypothetical protein
MSPAELLKIEVGYRPDLPTVWFDHARVTVRADGLAVLDLFAAIDYERQHERVEVFRGITSISHLAQIMSKAGELMAKAEEKARAGKA